MNRLILAAAATFSTVAVASAADAQSANRYRDARAQPRALYATNSLTNTQPGRVQMRSAAELQRSVEKSRNRAVREAYNERRDGARWRW